MSHHDTDAVRAAAREAEREGRRVLSTTEARQGSPKRTNLRVLIVSMVVLAAVGLALTVAYWGTAVEDHAILPGNAPQGSVSSPAPEAPGTVPQPENRPQPQP
jgi:hypothetical protein